MRPQEKVMETADEMNLKFRWHKNEYKVNTVWFIGHMIMPEGWKSKRKQGANVSIPTAGSSQHNKSHSTIQTTAGNGNTSIRKHWLTWKSFY